MNCGRVDAVAGLPPAVAFLEEVGHPLLPAGRKDQRRGEKIRSASCHCFLADSTVGRCGERRPNGSERLEVQMNLLVSDLRLVEAVEVLRPCHSCRFQGGGLWTNSRNHSITAPCGS